MAPQADAPADPAQRAREIALRVLTPGPRSAAQLRAALLAREVDPAVADEVIDRYTDVGLLDDAALAAQIARTRRAERGHSRAVIRRELARKGFAQDRVEAALAPMSDEDEAASAMRLARARWDHLAGVQREARVRRVVAHLGRKGYPPSVAFDLLRALERADMVNEPAVPSEEE